MSIFHIFLSHWTLLLVRLLDGIVSGRNAGWMTYRWRVIKKEIRIHENVFIMLLFSMFFYFIHCWFILSRIKSGMYKTLRYVRLSKWVSLLFVWSPANHFPTHKNTHIPYVHIRSVYVSTKMCAWVFALHIRLWRAQQYVATYLAYSTFTLGSIKWIDIIFAPSLTIQIKWLQTNAHLAGMTHKQFTFA